MIEKHIDDVFEFVRNGASIKQEDGKGGYPITRIETIWNETIDTERFGYADIGDDELKSYEKYLMREGDILMTHINSPKHLGKCAMYEGVPDQLIHGMNLLCLRAKEDISEPKYLKYFFNSKFFKFQLPKISNQSVNQASFSAGNLKKLQILLPPLAQQKKIAAILDAADGYRQKTRALIAKYDELTQSLFLDMFGDPVTNPKGWGKKPMGELMTIVRGGSPRPIKDYLGGNNPWIKIGDATKGDDLYLHATKEHITDAGLRKTRLLPEGSLIFANCGVSLGFARITKIQGCIHDGWLAFSNFDDNVLDKIFLLKSLNSVTNYFRATAPDGTQPNLNTKIMSKYEMILPPIELQKKFVQSLFSIHTQREHAQESLAKAEDLFNSLLQKAFKGEL